MDILNKQKVNMEIIKKIYGETKGDIMLTNIVNTHTDILKNIKDGEIFKEIKKNTNNKIDIATSISNFYIENKIQNDVINSLYTEVDELKINNTFINKENMYLKYLISHYFQK